ncbi:hypothetical protein PR048_018492 [Dryococelus australis]|uniref:Uncharacterized protein n=1 Tax=Dryococelus australis TaxID=614101 RepID=A0ABQ9HCL5_9NEOP|nr:hypothetical protein PR048_018492 [Dryococelus australis]
MWAVNFEKVCDVDALACSNSTAQERSLDLVIIQYPNVVYVQIPGLKETVLEASEFLLVIIWVTSDEVQVEFQHRANYCSVPYENDIAQSTGNSPLGHNQGLLTICHDVLHALTGAVPVDLLTHERGFLWHNCRGRKATNDQRKSNVGRNKVQCLRGHGNFKSILYCFKLTDTPLYLVCRIDDTVGDLLAVCGNVIEIHTAYQKRMGDLGINPFEMSSLVCSRMDYHVWMDYIVQLGNNL